MFVPDHTVNKFLQMIENRFYNQSNNLTANPNDESPDYT
jgi:hypothetical protein